MFIIGISGGTGSGKTTIVEKLMKENFANDICVIPQDSYYNDNSKMTFEERIAINFDHPDAIDFELLVEHLKQLKEGESIAQPVYSFTDHNRTNESKLTESKKIIIIEGILIFNNKKLRDLCDLKIFVEADNDERLIRRVRRDVEERGRDIDEILTRYQDTLKPMHAQFIQSTKKFADLIIPNNNFNNTAVTIVKSIIKNQL